MSNDNPDSLAPLSQAAPETPPSFPIQQLEKGSAQWTLTLHPSHIALAESPDAQPYVFLRDQVMKTAVFLEPVRALAIKQPFKATFKLTPEATAALAAWIGNRVLALHYLKQRYGWVLPIAGIWIISSLPMPGDPAKNLPAKPVDLFALGLGIALIASWAVAKWRPHPILFMVDSTWFLGLAFYIGLDIAHGASKGWLVMMAILLWLVTQGLKYFRRFRGTDLRS